jgi:hypothetical protein
VQLAPAAIMGQVLFIENSVASLPLTSREVKSRLPVPVLVTVIAKLSPNSMSTGNVELIAVGFTEIFATAVVEPVPLKATLYAGKKGSFEFTVMVALSAWAVDGIKRMLAGHEVPPAMVVHSSKALKSAAFAPVIVIELIISAFLPALEMVSFERVGGLNATVPKLTELPLRDISLLGLAACATVRD